MENRILLLLVSLIFLGGMNPGTSYAKVSPNLMCLATQCTQPLAGCTFERNCRVALSCTADCKMSDPEENQRCLINCVESNPSSRYDHLVGCMLEKNCLAKAPPRFCAKPRNTQQIAPVTLADLQGEWYVVRGLSRAYDCWPCQKMSFFNLKGSASSYDYEYRVGSNKTKIQCTVEDLPTPVPGRFFVKYKAHGVEGFDDWHLLSQPTRDHALIYYCGTTSLDQYRGAVIITRTPFVPIPQSILQTFEQALHDADLEVPVSLNQFCIAEQRSCTD
jgi:hypothetical protein